jgi:hypothetical protein
VWYDQAMRAIYMSICLAVLGGAAACGPAKPAESASHDDEASPASTAHETSHEAASDSDTPPGVAPTPAAPSAATPTAPSGSGVPYDKEAVEIGLKRAGRQVKANCGAATDQEGKATGPWGKASVTVKLGHNGHSQGATIGAPFDGQPVGKCITQAFAILTYPPFAGADTTIDWPIEVVAPAGAAAH